MTEITEETETQPDIPAEDLTNTENTEPETSETSEPEETEPESTEPEYDVIRISGKTYRVYHATGRRYREINGYIRSEVIAELQEVRKCLRKARGVKGYSVASRRIEYQTLSDLRQQEQELLELLAQFDNDTADGNIRMQFAIPTD